MGGMVDDLWMLEIFSRLFGVVEYFCVVLLKIFGGGGGKLLGVGLKEVKCDIGNRI